MLTNLGRELLKAKKLTRANIKLSVYSITEWYINSLKHMAMEKRMSNLEVAVKNAEHDLKEEMKRKAHRYADSVKIETLKKKPRR